jgi:hypothetical protein
VVFEEEVKRNWGGEEQDSEFVIDYVSVSHPETLNLRPRALNAFPNHRAASASPGPGAASPAPHSPPVSSALSTLDTGHGNAPVCYRSIQDIMAVTAPVDPVPGELGEDLLMVNTDEPASFQEAQVYDC